MIRGLVEYKQKTGHLRLPLKYHYDNRNLREWFLRQRSKCRNAGLDKAIWAQRARILENIGVEINSHKHFDETVDKRPSACLLQSTQLQKASTKIKDAVNDSSGNCNISRVDSDLDSAVAREGVAKINLETLRVSAYESNHDDQTDLPNDRTRREKGIKRRGSTVFQVISTRPYQRKVAEGTPIFMSTLIKSEKRTQPTYTAVVIRRVASTMLCGKSGCSFSLITQKRTGLSMYPEAREVH
jgi:hypothetical protein